MWEVFLYDKNGSFMYELPIEGLSLDFKLNNIWVFNGRVNYYVFKRRVERYGDTVENALIGGFREIRVKKNGVVRFRGILSEVNISKAQVDINISLTAKSWLAYFSKRFITKTYTNTDAGQIAWDLINTAQQETDGNIGITQGTIEATVNRNRTYKDDEIAKSIIHLAWPNILNGFDFEISNDKVFTVKQRLGVDKPYIVLDERNIESWQVDFFTGLSLTNKVISRGNGTGDTQPRVETTPDPTYTSKWYLLEEVRNDTGVEQTDTLLDKANMYVEKHRSPWKSFTVKLKMTNVNESDFDIGDGVKVVIEDFVNGIYRIYRKQIRFSNDTEDVNLEFIF